MEKVGDKSLVVLLKFISGEITAQEFERELYENAELEELLRKSTDWSGTFIEDYAANLYDYLIVINYSQIDGMMNAVEALELYLTKEKIPFPKRNKYSDFYNLILDSQPKYLDIDTLFIEKYILPADSNLPKTELKKVIRSNFKRYFRFQNKPPRWIQNPAWIIKNEKTLFFIGQLELKNEVFHDNGTVYVFFNEETGEVETVKQFHLNILQINGFTKKGIQDLASNTPTH